MSFTKAGDIKVKIIEAILADCKYDADKNVGGFDVALKVQAADGENGWWQSAVSVNIPDGAWNKDRDSNDKLTQKALARIGFEGGADYSRIEELVGRETIATVKEREYDGKKYYDVKYLGDGGLGPKAIDKNEAILRYKKMMAGAASGALSPDAATTTAAKPATTSKTLNPFKV
jgi:hypothetical protein